MAAWDWMVDHWFITLAMFYVFLFCWGWWLR